MRLCTSVRTLDGAVLILKTFFLSFVLEFLYIFIQKKGRTQLV